jgi:drug/metabolite transporter (DMT)-like permease
MLGVILSFWMAIAFGINAIIVRRGVLQASSHYIATISLFTGPPFFLLVTCTTTEIFQIGKLPWEAHFYLALSGVIHLALGRTWAYKSIQLIGATRSQIVIGLNPIVSIILAVIILKETINSLMFLGILFILSGPILTILKEKTVESSPRLKEISNGKELDRYTLYKGIFYGVGTAIFWGSSPIFIKLGLENGGSPITGSFIAYLAASIVVSTSLLLNPKSIGEIFEPNRKSFRIALFSGLTTNIAQLLRYLALNYSSVIIVTLLLRTTPLWVLLFSFIFNRKYESFNHWVLLSNFLLIVGTILVLIA